MIKCPRCKKPGISIWKKACMGPAWPRDCTKCKKKIGVPWSSAIYAVPFVIAATYFEFPITSINPIIALIVTFCFYLVMHVKYVPLIAKD